MARLRQVSDRTRLLLGFGALVVLLLAAGVAAYQGLAAMRADVIALGDQHVAALARLAESGSTAAVEQRIADVRVQALRSSFEAHQSYLVALTLVAGSLLLALGVIAWLARATHRATDRPLAPLIHVLERVAAGDLTVSVGAEPEGEMGQLSAAVRRMVEKLRLVIAQTIQHERLKALGKMASGAAHDLNNLLAIILGHADVLLVESGKEREPLAAIRKAALNGRETLRRLQQFTVNGYLDEEPVWIDPRRAVEELVVFATPQWRYRAEERGVTYEIAMDFSPAPSILVRPSAIREVLLNLFLNALEAMPGGGRIDLRVHGERDGAVIEVGDTGPGIPESIRMCIFDPFFTTKPAPAGGLGLSICSTIVSDLGGAIEVDTKPGRGSTFAVRLPLMPPAGAGAAWRARVRQKLPRASRLLLISDDVAVAGGLAAMLHEAGHGVERAASGAEGIERYRNGAFDGVIAELGMQGLSGLTVCRAIKDHDPKAHVVLLAGGGRQVDANHREAAGVSGVLLKPVSREDVLAMFETADESRRRGAREESWARS
jgi:signal transduction histidine kinase/CheY-like chemotaxis protein